MSARAHAMTDAHSLDAVPTEDANEAGPNGAPAPPHSPSHRHRSGTCTTCPWTRPGTKRLRIRPDPNAGGRTVERGKVGL